MHFSVIFQDDLFISRPFYKTQRADQKDLLFVLDLQTVPRSPKSYDYDQIA